MDTIEIEKKILKTRVLMLVNIPCNAIRDHALKCQLNQARKTYEVSTSPNLCAAHVPEQMPTPLILLAWPNFCFRENTNSTKQNIKKRQHY